MIKTVSLQLAKELKEAGFPQESAEYYWSDIDEGTDESWVLRHKSKEHGYPRIAAPTADEILDVLPKEIKRNNEIYWLSITPYLHKDGWACEYRNNRRVFIYYEELSTVEAVGEMYLYCRKNNLL